MSKQLLECIFIKFLKYIKHKFNHEFIESYTIFLACWVTGNIALSKTLLLMSACSTLMSNTSQQRCNATVHLAPSCEVRQYCMEKGINAWIGKFLKSLWGDLLRFSLNHVRYCTGKIHVYIKSMMYQALPHDTEVLTFCESCCFFSWCQALWPLWM